MEEAIQEFWGGKSQVLLETRAGVLLDDDALVLSLKGSFGEDSAELAPLQDAFDAWSRLRTHRHLVLDLSEVEYINSMFLGLLVRLTREAWEIDGSVQLVGLYDGFVRKRLEITCLIKLFRVHDTVEEALLAIQEGTCFTERARSFRVP